ncbi:bifunctional 4-hydroxy-2-oxoglutarate aldolase/2-dehydro-3-deoxy-phosphogluconate aldolase [Mycobacterium sp. smrl_JER01]|uniref:bifunctional 4-hydroxy-2-oxoglutarate aldolase/2-dehydro-3-deoxy-phosphogluconate aldolase n=1 Tax=Mycobacterium sp. smrl_JER01 TaxID=3402633 RepID=UPI003AD5B8C6
MTSVQSLDLRSHLEKCRILPVVDVTDTDDARHLGSALLASGMAALELTLRRPGALDAVAAAAEDTRMLVGAGTVLTAGQARDCLAAGARFVVSPGTDREVITACLDAGVPVLPGVATPTDLMAAISMGIDTVKFFPAQALGGVTTIRALANPFQAVRFVPTGGIDTTNVPAYLAEHSVLAVGGSWMAPKELIQRRDWGAISDLARQALRMVDRE